jgi:xanthine/uracil permease
VAAVALDPFWMGVAVAYVGVVAWWLTRTVRRHLLRARSLYGELGPADDSRANSRLSVFVLGGAVALGVVAIWDVFERGWVGSFGIALALVLGWVGLRLRTG